MGDAYDIGLSFSLIIVFLAPSCFGSFVFISGIARFDFGSLPNLSLIIFKISFS